MKRYSNLYSQITDIGNVKLAIWNASKDKRDRQQVKRILKDLDKYALYIQEMLVNKTYVPSPYKIDIIIDGSSQKKREICKPRFYPDQCIHWAVMLVTRPLFAKRMYQWSCASIDGRGIFYAKDYIRGALKDKKNTRYAYQLDVSKFYPSVDNELLKQKLAKMFKDKEVLWLFNTIIDSAKGLPIGNFTSQWLANFYLDDLDKYIKEELHIRYYVRYADDMLLFASNKRELHKKRKLIENYIKNQKLSVKRNWKVFKVDSRPIDFIGFRFYRDHVVLRKYLYLRIKRKAKKIHKKGYISLKNARGMTSYWGYIINTDSNNFYHNDIEPNCSIDKCKERISNETKKHLQTY